MPTDHTSHISKRIRESMLVKEKMLRSEDIIGDINKGVSAITHALHKGGKVLFCGNGGSAADAQHLSAELSGRFRKDRPPLYAEALHVNTSFLTAVANDYDFEETYVRMLTAMGKKGDVLVALSTSGQSANVLKAARKAVDLNMTVIGLTGRDGGNLAGMSHIEIRIPSDDTARIQEGHMVAGHLICELVEAELFPNG